MRTVISETIISVENLKFLGSRHGVDVAKTVTLDRSAFTEAKHFPTGSFTPGILLGKITATGLYGPLDTSLSNGQEKFAGVLLDAHRDSGTDTKNVVANMLWHGDVIAAELPVAAEDVAGGGIPAAIAYDPGPDLVLAQTGIEQLVFDRPTIAWE